MKPDKVFYMLAAALMTTWYPPSSLARDDSQGAADAERMAISALSPDKRKELEQKIDDIANDVVNRKAYFDPDMRPITLKSSLDPVTGRLVMFMEKRFGPVSGHFEIEDLRADVTEAVRPAISHLQEIDWFDWRYGGNDMYFWFPGDRPRDATVTPG